MKIITKETENKLTGVKKKEIYLLINGKEEFFGAADDTPKYLKLKTEARRFLEQ